MESMRVTLAITLVLLFLAAMPANCAQDPPVWFGVVAVGGEARQARYEVTTNGAGRLREVVYAPYGRTPVAFEQVVHTGDELTFAWSREARYTCRLRRDAPTSFAGTCTASSRSPITIIVRQFSREDSAMQGQGLPPSATDLAILDRARTLLADGRSWNRQDRRVCDDSAYPYRWSLFCALHQASIDVDGDYRHLRPVVRAVREAIQRRSAGRTFAHTLRDFNNDAPTFDAIAQVLDDTRRTLASQVR